MPTDFNIAFSIALLLAAGQGLFLALLLILRRKANWQANRYLGFFTLVIVITLVDNALFNLVASDSMIALKTFVWPRDFLYGPAIYFYVREMTLPRKHPFLPKQWLHFLPAIIHALIFWTMPWWHTELHWVLFADPDLVPRNLQNADDIVTVVETVLAIPHVAIYLWLAIRCLTQHRLNLSNTFSYIEKVNLNWLRVLLLGIAIIYSLWVLDEINNFFFDIPTLSESTTDITSYILNASFIVLIYLMSILGLRQPLIFANPELERISADDVATDTTKDTQNPSTKYRTSSLSTDLSAQLAHELKMLMETEKPYLQDKLSLPQLADMLGVSVNYLSQVINEQFAQNFFEFVNNYRVQEAKNTLEDPTQKNQNILAIALDSGFRSKSSFYTAFKKHTGVTPGQYREQLVTTDPSIED